MTSKGLFDGRNQTISAVARNGRRGSQIACISLRKVLLPGALVATNVAGMRFKTIRPAAGPLDAVVRPPGSKSLTNRALILAALADGDTELTGALFSDDTELMIDALRTLGIKVDADRDGERIAVTGCGGNIPATAAELFCGNSGTTIRFCTALCALGAGPYVLDGNDRMRQRPIADLVDALRATGALVGYVNQEEEGYPPVEVRRGGLRGGRITFDAPASSQYVSALLMVAPYAMEDLFVELRWMVSAPYLVMTTKLMGSFGVSVVESTDGRSARYIVPAPQRYTGRSYAIEPDASNASYFLAAPAIAGGQVRVEELGMNSIQGDIQFVDVLEEMGCRIDRKADSLCVYGPPPGQRLRGVDVDLNDMPDVAQTLAVVALFAEGPTTIRNVGNLRVKETDRLTALATELGKFDARVEIREDGLTIHPPGKPVPARVETYDDHRMAMSFALAGLAVDGVEILDPTCVNKTFPGYFECLERMADSARR
jgi:3-phosphoshikimate 1-carboxyvinyltransferase